MDKAVFIGLGRVLVEKSARGSESTALVRAASRAIPPLCEAGFELVIIAHEPGVALGVTPEEDVAAEARRLDRAIAGIHAGLRGFYYCPHDPSGTIPEYALDCLCRRPQPGLIIRAASELGIDTSTSWVVGDLLDDIEAGRRAGCRTVLVDTGSETEWRISQYRVPHFLARDLAKAARLILAAERKHSIAPGGQAL